VAFVFKKLLDGLLMASPRWINKNVILSTCKVYLTQLSTVDKYFHKDVKKSHYKNVEFFWNILRLSIITGTFTV